MRQHEILARKTHSAVMAEAAAHTVRFFVAAICFFFYTLITVFVYIFVNMSKHTD